LSLKSKSVCAVAHTLPFFCHPLFSPLLVIEFWALFGVFSFIYSFCSQISSICVSQ
jgi:hypothetical protein